MRKLKVHKDGKDKTPCGITCWISAKRGNEWKYVTCKNCLAKRPPFKIKDHPKDNLKEINEELNNLPWTTENVELDATVPAVIKMKDEAYVPAAIKTFAEELNRKQGNKTPFDKWEEWFKLCCDHSFSPQPGEVWDGAIDTICAYLTNEMCSELGLDETKRILDKTKKKFKTE